MKKYLLTFYVAILCMLFITNVNAQLTSSEAGYINEVIDYGADNTSSSVATSQLQYKPNPHCSTFAIPSG